MTQSNDFRIRHTVAFRHKEGSPEEKDFLAAAEELANIPEVEEFERLKQIGQKNNFDWGLSMEFANQETYDRYNEHPDHVAFVEQRWKKEVEDFMEIDYKL